MPIDPEGAYALAHDDYDVYRIELDGISEAIAKGADLPFGRTDAIDQARALEALDEASRRAAPVELPRPSPDDQVSPLEPRYRRSA